MSVNVFGPCVVTDAYARTGLFAESHGIVANVRIYLSVDYAPLSIILKCQYYSTLRIFGIQRPRLHSLILTRNYRGMLRGGVESQ